MKGLSLLFSFFIVPYITYAADPWRAVRTIQVQGRIMSVDELCNVYIVTHDNALLRYGPDGDSNAVFRLISSGPLGMVDPANPLHILLYYPRFSKVIVLDQVFSVKSETDLRQLNLNQESIVAAGVDGNTWVYDRFNAKLDKLDARLNYILRGDDLRQYMMAVPAPVYMAERERKVYLCDTSLGVFVFDQYGTYIHTLPLYNIRYLGVEGSALIYMSGHTLYKYDMQNMSTVEMNIPGKEGDKIVTATTCHDTLYVLYTNRLVLYRKDK